MKLRTHWSSFVEPPQSMCTDGCGPSQTTGHHR